MWDPYQPGPLHFGDESAIRTTLRCLAALTDLRLCVCQQTSWPYDAWKHRLISPKSRQTISARHRELYVALCHDRFHQYRDKIQKRPPFSSPVTRFWPSARIFEPQHAFSSHTTPFYPSLSFSNTIHSIHNSFHAFPSPSHPYSPYFRIFAFSTPHSHFQPLTCLFTCLWPLSTISEPHFLFSRPHNRFWVLTPISNPLRTISSVFTYFHPFPPHNHSFSSLFTYSQTLPPFSNLFYTFSSIFHLFHCF